MPELSGFAQVAPYLTHPLVLTGFGLLLFFALLRAVLKSGIVPTISQAAGARTLEQLLRYGFVVAILVIVSGFGLAFYQTERETVDVDEIIRDFARAREQVAEHQSTLESIARLDQLEDGDAFREAVLALVRRQDQPDAPEGIDRALELLRQGQTGPAERVLAEVLDAKLEQRESASAQAAEAARHLGAIAYLDDTARALDAYRLATELDPDDAWSWIYLGRLRQRIGNLEGAESAFAEAMEAAEKSGSERDASVAWNSLGDVRVAQGDLAGALEAYQADLAIAEDLVVRDAGNTGWQRDLSVSHEKIGDVRVAQGNLSGALATYEAGLAIAKDLASRDPGNAEWQRDLIVSHWKLADVAEKAGEAAEATRRYGKALKIARELAESGRLAPRDSWMVGDLEQRLERLGS